MIRNVRDKVHKPVACSAVKWVKPPFLKAVLRSVRTRAHLFTKAGFVSCVLNAGLSPDLQSMEQIRRIMRPTDVPDTGRSTNRRAQNWKGGQFHQ